MPYMTSPIMLKNRKTKDSAVLNSGIVRLFAVVIRLPIVKPKAAVHSVLDSIANK